MNHSIVPFLRCLPALLVLASGCTSVRNKANEAYSQDSYENHLFRIGLERRLTAIEEDILIHSPERYYLVSGAVHYPGLYEYKPKIGVTVEGAIIEAFGLRPLKGRLQITVRRFDRETGKWNYRGSWATVSEVADFELHPGDELCVEDVILDP